MGKPPGFAVSLLTFAALACPHSGPTPPDHPPDDSRASYILGTDDQISVQALEVEELANKVYRIDMRGNLRLPLIGRLRASGLTVDQLEKQIGEALKSYIKEPDVTVSIIEFRSQPVSILGSVKQPGVHQLRGRKTLVEILSLAGGLSDDAGHSIKITRRAEWGAIPIRNAASDPTGQFSVAEVSLEAILAARRPEQNIVIKPNDVISIPRADMIYVTGQVAKAGGYVLRERETLSVLQALALAGGLGPGASPRNTRILRRTTSTADRQEISVNLDNILSGKVGDIPMQAEDILLVPSSVPKKAALRSIEAAIQIGTGVVIWRR